MATVAVGGDRQVPGQSMQSVCRRQWRRTSTANVAVSWPMPVRLVLAVRSRAPQGLAVPGCGSGTSWPWTASGLPPDATAEWAHEFLPLQCPAIPSALPSSGRYAPELHTAARVPAALRCPGVRPKAVSRGERLPVHRALADRMTLDHQPDRQPRGGPACPAQLTGPVAARHRVRSRVRRPLPDTASTAQTSRRRLDRARGKLLHIPVASATRAKTRASMTARRRPARSSRTGHGTTSLDRKV